MHRSWDLALAGLTAHDTRGLSRVVCVEQLVLASGERVLLPQPRAEHLKHTIAVEHHAASTGPRLSSFCTGQVRNGADAGRGRQMLQTG